MAEPDAWARCNAGYDSSSAPFSVGLVGAWLSIGRAELVACSLLARNIFITFSHARQSVATASSTYFCPQKLSQLIFSLRDFLGGFCKKNYKAWNGENYLVGKFSFISLVTFQYLVYDTQIMMGGGKMYAISPEEYIFAALNLYLDIVNLFLYILQLISAARN